MKNSKPTGKHRMTRICRRKLRNKWSSQYKKIDEKNYLQRRLHSAVCFLIGQSNIWVTFFFAESKLIADPTKEICFNNYFKLYMIIGETKNMFIHE